MAQANMYQNKLSICAEHTFDEKRGVSITDTPPIIKNDRNQSLELITEFSCY